MADNAPSTADTVNHVVDKVFNGLDQLTHAVAQHAPEAWSLAVRGTYAQGASKLLTGAILLAFALLVFTIAIILINRCMKLEKASADEGLVLLCGIAGGLGLFIGTVLLVISTVTVCDSDAWAKVISPDGYLATQLLQKAVGG